MAEKKTKKTKITKEDRIDGVYYREPYRYRIFEKGNRDFFAHYHEQVEICYCLSGTVRIMVEGMEYELASGDIAVAFPNVQHSYQRKEDEQDSRCYVLLFLPEQTEDFYTEYINMLPLCPVLRSNELPVHMHSVMEQFHAQFRSGEMEDERIFKAYAQLITAHLLTKMELRLRTAAYSPETVQAVSNYIGQHFKQPVTLKSMSKDLGISTSALSKIFSEQMNTSFREMLNAKRISHAQKKLRNSDMEIKQVIALSGFSSARSFFRVFRESTGMTPTQYREKYRKK